MEQHTAALFEPYADMPGTRGDTFYDPQAFADLGTELDARSFQVLIHAVGDGGVHVALDAIARARQVNGPRDARHQLVHVEPDHQPHPRCRVCAWRLSSADVACCAHIGHFWRCPRRAPPQIRARCGRG